jgi:hypothetical protein
MFNIFQYTPPGEVANAFIQDDDSDVPFLMGPIGSGKTTTCIFKRARFAMRMPVCTDGIIRCKAIIVRDSMRTIEKTVLPSWFNFFPKDFPGSEWTGGNDRPATHTINLQMPGGVQLKMITEFVGLGSDRIEDVLRGREYSFLWDNEADLQQREVISYGYSRLGRYPSRALLKPDAVIPKQVIGDLNAPDIGSWVYEDFIEKPIDGYKLYRQPSGLSARAENIKVLGPNYYPDIVKQNPKWFVRRMVENEFGYARDGQPVYEEFNDQLHVADKALEVDPDLPLIIGMDAGLTPAAVFGQPTRLPSMRILDEVVPGHGYGAVRFAELVADLLARRYAGVRQIQIYADPAAQYGADREGGELSWIETIGRALGLPVLIPGNGSNELGLRLDAVRHPLVFLPDGRTPGLIVSPNCKILIRGFASGYRYQKQHTGMGEKFSERPDKNEYSHVHDALQYLMLGWRGRGGVISEANRVSGQKQRATSRASRPRRAGGFDVHNL